ncbi:outer membrane beta-barrel protein [Helicobacter bilis]|uniref:outer membrane beta-barrel protein n=1 Tax=Helicobacter bilis TaxID=37372 RepID=UPI0025AA2F0C|nr:outer membrane beta-barrel protein [Helicobacter bilis]
MKTIGKCVASLALVLALVVSVGVAEESGLFIGIGTGYGQSEIKTDSTKTKLDGLSFESIAGYKSFFTPAFGMRYYINFAYSNAEAKKDPKPKVIMNYGVNADMLYNVVVSQSVNLGAFVGVGVGANTWAAKDNVDFKVKTGFNVALNAGLRSQFGKHHGIEVVARVPFISTTLENHRVTGEKQTGSHTYNVGARYILSF